VSLPAQSNLLDPTVITDALSSISSIPTLDGLVGLKSCIIEIEDAPVAFANHKLLIEDPNSIEHRVDKFLFANKPVIASGVPSLNDLLQFESDVR